MSWTSNPLHEQVAVPHTRLQTNPPLPGCECSSCGEPVLCYDLAWTIHKKWEEKRQVCSNRIAVVLLLLQGRRVPVVVLQNRWISLLGLILDQRELTFIECNGNIPQQVIFQSLTHCHNPARGEKMVPQCLPFPGAVDTLRGLTCPRFQLSTVLFISSFWTLVFDIKTALHKLQT